ncbi:TAP domain protein [Kribbella flavida DSM 17836]|uniref:TAP domain protein n=1 Tax=Kribbella flavida (strain DSM 17836 / JCM 10339 / NBRC 14399) TaxID=479435 RepID=D2Q3I6_KRIFD|nr:alpha/beta fold hydrolase [Kribbella flavida]ADB34109.1 TAP domain protein [Kribbella flavida DSM 17836]
MRAMIASVLAAMVLAGTAGHAVAEDGGGSADGVRWHASCATGPDDELGSKLDEAKARCGEISVPLDYRDPDGRHLTVAFSHLPAKDRADRIGALVLNDGGPGVGALGMPLRLRDTLGQYDLIGMDPRFTGRSTPLDCGWPTALHLRAAPTRAAFADALHLSRDLADRCSKDKDVLPHATTANTARDMDRLRIALGEPRLHYLGYSYGSYLGMVYLQLFGQYAGRFVLDGPVAPDRIGSDLLRETGPANEAALRDWAQWAAGQDATYHLGRTPAQVVAGVQELISTAERRPLPVGEHRVDAGVLPVMLWMLVPDDRPEGNAMLARVVMDLRAAARGESVDPDSPLMALAGFLLTGKESATASALAAITCADRATAVTARSAWPDIQRHRRTEPVFGSLVRNVGVCAYWPTRPVQTPVTIGNDRPALLITATRDTRVTWDQALASRRVLTGSRLLSVNARKHGLYREYGNACVDRTTTEYLLTGRLPRADTTC